MKAGSKMDREVGLRVFESSEINPPPYSTDIAAAWCIVEKLRTDGWAVVVEVAPDGSANCMVQDQASRDSWADETGTTTPEAICLAALAMESWGDDVKSRWKEGNP